MAQSPDQTAAYIRLLRENERQLIVYVRALVPSRADAEDLIQETRIRLWEQFDQFEPGTNFAAWACTVAKYLIMSHRKKLSREKLQFSQEAIDNISAEIDHMNSQEDARSEALPRCVSALSESNRQLLAMCYSSDLQIQEVAEMLDRSANATYLALSRVRKWLRDCIERRSKSEQGIAL